MTLIKYFTVKPAIHDEDYLSVLPDDCFIAICTSKDDLDVLAAVNQRLCHASKNSRDSAQKAFAFSLRVQVHTAWSEVKSASSYVLKQAAFLLGRYRFKEVLFESMVIDHDFVNIFERAIHNKSFKVRTLHFRKCSLEKPRYSDVSKRFLRKLADGIQYPILIAHGSISKQDLFRVEANFADVLVKFDRLNCNTLMVGAEWVISAIKA
ncbi:hypothetical protein PRIPAC_85628, partial [Pristionchus pacificus]|uniref:Uncharacterized protein n=1 Tax=Pristionchus pacificus TaxID=54126 RepID=A0A2A6BN20_PRIPA